jgi:beta-fructofuranosidase
LQSTEHVKLLLRYRDFHLELFCNGSLVDEEWPIGKLGMGAHPRISIKRPIVQLSVWNSALTDKKLVSLYGGTQSIAHETEALLGPQPRFIQSSRPRGFNTNAGDAMPFYHDGTFHLFYLLDRRQHHSKWGLGAHQWGHISSTDLIHWKHYPVALAIDHDWEGSICTGSVFFENGRYYAYYATRMPDRSEHLAMAQSTDGIHFKKSIPTPFAEPAAPYVHGPNRDPFVFRANGGFHMIVTAAIPMRDASGNEGALEHLVSKDLSHWTPLKDPFLLSGSDAQPECSDLMKWKGWYYLLYSLGGTTHYRMAKNALGPWRVPTSDILDGPEAIVMKAAEFKGDRRIMVGFVQHDNRYGGDLVFRELIQRADGSLGTKVPKEMEWALNSPKSVPDTNLSAAQSTMKLVGIGTDAEVVATVSINDQTPFVITIDSNNEKTKNEQVIFDPVHETVMWAGGSGKPERAQMHHVADLNQPVSVILTLRGTLADLSINGERTLIHRLVSSDHQNLSLVTKGKNTEISRIRYSSLR